MERGRRLEQHIQTHSLQPAFQIKADEMDASVARSLCMLGACDGTEKQKPQNTPKPLLQVVLVT